MLVRTLVLAIAIASLAGCVSTSKPASVAADPIRQALGDRLPGARGLTPDDQMRIDETIAGGCAIGVWRPIECRRHGQ